MDMRARAHFGAVMTGSAVVMFGARLALGGWMGGAKGDIKWISGLVNFGVLAFVSLSVALAVSWMCGRLFRDPEWPALTIGAGVGLALIPVLHPDMYSNLSMDSHPATLIAIHLCAGLFGAPVWLWLENPTPAVREGQQ